VVGFERAGVRRLLGCALAACCSRRRDGKMAGAALLPSAVDKAGSVVLR